MTSRLCGVLLHRVQTQTVTYTALISWANSACGVVANMPVKLLVITSGITRRTLLAVLDAAWWFDGRSCACPINKTQGSKLTVS